MAELRAIADRAGARIVADAAHAFGSRHVDRPVGAYGDAEVFSIGATKPLATDEGALIAARDRDVEARLRRFAFHGGSPGVSDTGGLGMRLCRDARSSLTLGGSATEYRGDAGRDRLEGVGQ